MASAREIQSRMKSIQDTMKITNAMYMISSSKMQKAKKSLSDTEPLFYAQQEAVAKFVKGMPETHSIYFGEKNIPEEEKKRGYIVITADKGLAGAYNHNVLKLAMEALEKGKDNKLFVVGELGRQYLMHKGYEIDEEFSYTVQNPTLYRARHIQQRILELYLNNELDEVYIIYTRMINAFKMEAEQFKLLPLAKEDYVKEDQKYYSGEVSFHPSVESVLDNLIPNVVAGFIYGALVESYASEHNSRMMAMQTATDSAKEMLHDLEIEYNRVRQAAITQEITEVIAGAKAQKNKKK